jgi:two-component system sensor histidine kinase GlrK
LYRPRSIVRLILIGFAVVVTPLIAAVVTAVFEVRRLAMDSQEAVLEAQIATQQGRLLLESLPEMQRALGQFQVFGDPDLYDSYLDRRMAFGNAVNNLLELNLTQTGRDQLLKLKGEEQELFSTVRREANPPGSGVSPNNASQRWTGLVSRARAVLAESNQLIETQASYAMSSANQVQRTLLLQAAAVIPATVVLAVVFAVLINRPMRQVGEAIRRLGARELSTPIEVEGPRDVEELGKQLDWLRRRIEELEHQKVTFVRHISHELKTPLTTIREGAELLAESLAGRAPEEAEISRIMRINSLRLQKLIEDLLQFGKTQELITDLKVVESVDLRALVHEVVASQALACTAKEIRLDQRLSEASVRADASKVRIVVDNLLTNAIKYTPPGGQIEVLLTVADEHAVIEVRDTGPGIAPGEVARVFEPFFQGQAEYQSSVKGTGLGLTIAKEYVEAHDGYIEVVGSGSGAHFRVGFALAGPKAFRSG